jgi:uncharacterized damage-inducible protein DinB
VPLAFEEGTMKRMCMVLALVALGTPAAAQTALTQGEKQTYELIKGNITKSAEKVGEELYSFRPTPEVRSFGELIGHIADANQMICATAVSGAPAKEKVEKVKTSKADLQKALADSFAVCDAAFAGMTDAKGAEMVKFFGGERPRLAVLSFNTAHDFEHYGNLVTYMRLKNIVPPSSEKRPSN